MVWWKRFGLIREPKLDVFPLSIENAYLFVETRRSATLGTLLSRLEDPMLLLRKVYAIIGPFGSGKTTFVAYVRYKFHLKSISICSININWKLKPIASPHDVRNWFLEEMQKQLRRICDEMIEGDGLKVVAEWFAEKKDFDEEDIIKVIEELRGYYDGFIILVDELHREEEAKNVGYILDFLKTMQPFFTDICKHPVAFFIACHEDWEKNLQLAKYSGIFSDIIILPPWNAEDAYILIDRRLRDASADKSKFKNPILPGSLEKLVTLAIVKTYCPREWIVHAKRMFENAPEEINEITPVVVSRIFSQVDIVKVEQIRYFASSEFPIANRFIDSVLRSDVKEAVKLLTVVARMYHNDLPRPLPEEVCKRVGIEDLPLLIEALKQQKIVNEGRRTSPPRKVGKGAVETLYQEVYRLNGNMTQFFEKVEEKFGLEPEDYLLRFVEPEIGPTEKESVVESEANLERMKKIAEKLSIPRAKDHLLCAMEDYSTFIGSAFSSLAISRTVARSGIMAVYNIVGAFITEKTRDQQHSVDIEKDTEVLKAVLKPGEKLVRTIARLYDEFKDIENTGKPIQEEFSDSAKSQIPRIVSKLLILFDTWASKSPEERLALETQESMEQIKSKILRDLPTIRKGAIDYMKTLTEQREIVGIDEKWLDAFLKFLEPKGVDATIMEIVDIRCNPQLYPAEKSQAYKTALHKVGLAFENILMIIGRNHVDPKVKDIFVTKEVLTAESMLARLFEHDSALKTMLRSYSGFDRSTNGKDFERKVKELLDDREFAKTPHYIRYYTLSTLVRNYYSHEGCQDTLLNKDESLFQQVINEGLLSALSIFRYFASRNLVSNFRA